MGSDSKVYKVSKNVDGSSSVEELSPLKLEDGGQAGWSLEQFSQYGIDYVALIAEKNAAVYPIHAAPVAFFGFVAEGSGIAYQGDASDQFTTSVEYKQGDIILFDPDTRHGWKSTSERSKLVFFKAGE